MQDIQRAAERFSALKKVLYSEVADAQREAMNLSGSIVDPSSADAEAIWAVLWPKPLYAGKQTKVAKVWYEQIEPKMAGTWMNMSRNDGPYAIRREIRLDKSGTRNVSSFVPVGMEIKSLKLMANAPPQSYYAIVGAGLALTKLAKQNERPFSHLPPQITADTIKGLVADFGYGWRHITVMHFLADLGLCCKPDIHLLRTMRALGLYSKKSDSDPTLPQALEVNRLVKAILIALDGKATPQGLRELDKNLMDISKNKLI